MHPVQVQAFLIQLLIFPALKVYLYCTATTNSNVAMYNFVLYVMYVNKE